MDIACDFVKLSAEQISALQAAAQSGRLRTWGQVLHSVTLRGSKTCDTDAGGCGRYCPVQSFVYVPAPWCFVVRLAWERARESPEAIRGTLAAVQEVVYSPKSVWVHAVGALALYDVSGPWACMVEQGACTEPYWSNA